MRRNQRPYRPTFHLSGERPRGLLRRVTPVTWLIVALLILFASLGVGTAVRITARADAAVQSR